MTIELVVVFEEGTSDASADLILKSVMFLRSVEHVYKRDSASEAQAMERRIALGQVQTLNGLISDLNVELREAMLAAQGKPPTPEPIEPSAEDVVEYPEHPSVIDAQEEAARKHAEKTRDALIAEISAMLRAAPGYRTSRVLNFLRNGGSI